MKIVFVIRWHSDKMGYANNCLAEEFARQGHEIHIITSKYQSYFNIPNYNEIYGKFLGPPILPLGSTEYRGIKVHRVSSIRIKNRIILTGVLSKLRKIQPDVIQTFDVHELSTVLVSLVKPFFKYKLFTGMHTILITYRVLLNWRKLNTKRKILWSVLFYWPTRILVRNYEICYAVTRDATMIAHKMFGVPYSKIKVQTLGVDMSFYNKNINEEINNTRKNLGYNDKDVVCLFTGKINEEKKPELLCKAIEELNQKGYSFKALFIGSGTSDIVQRLLKYENCKVLNFIPSEQLHTYYKMADIAVWPNSITTSILDAAACAKPVVVSNSVYAYDLVRGKQNGKHKILAAFFKDGVSTDLAIELEKLNDCNLRKEIGELAFKYIEENLSWKSIALKRISDYQKVF